MTGSGIQAATVSFGTGWLLLALMLLAYPPYRQGVRRVAVAVRRGEMPWWQVIGGIFGGFFVGVQGLTVPVIGVAVFTVAVVAGQSSSSLFVDKVGLGPAGRQPITAARVISAILAVAAVAIAVSDRITGFTLAEVWPVILAFLAGFFISGQQAINGRVAAVARQPVSAGFVNFSLGFVMLGAILGIAWAVSEADPGPLPTGPWWIYSGGAVGVAFIVTAAWVVQRLGVLLFALLTIGGQLLGALVLDIVAPTAGNWVHATLIVGVFVAALAVAVGSLPAWRSHARRMPHPPLR